MEGDREKGAKRKKKNRPINDFFPIIFQVFSFYRQALSNFLPSSVTKKRNVKNRKEVQLIIPLSKYTFSHLTWLN